MTNHLRRLQDIAREQLQRKLSARPNSHEYFEANRMYADAMLMIGFYHGQESPRDDATSNGVSSEVSSNGVNVHPDSYIQGERK